MNDGSIILQIQPFHHAMETSVPKSILILFFILSSHSLLSANASDSTETASALIQQKSDADQGTRKRECYFMFSTDFFWHKGLESSVVTAGPCLNLGIETSRNNYFGINYYWGVLNAKIDQTYGGGFVYKHTFRLGKTFMICPGAQIGYWDVRWLKGYNKKGKDDFFGGPLLSLNVGYDRVCFRPEFFLSIGTGGIIPTYSVGVNWRVKESTRIRKTRFIFSTNYYWIPNGNPDRRALGPSISMGFETQRKNYYGGVYYGPIYYGDLSEFYGGGIVYKHNFYIGKFLIFSPGAQSGFWLMSWSVYDSDDVKIDPGSYFGGPLVSMEIGYKRAFVKPDITFLIGTDKVLTIFSIGLSFNI